MRNHGEDKASKQRQFNITLSNSKKKEIMPPPFQNHVMQAQAAAEKRMRNSQPLTDGNKVARLSNNFIIERQREERNVIQKLQEHHPFMDPQFSILGSDNDHSLSVLREQNQQNNDLRQISKREVSEERCTSPILVGSSRPDPFLNNTGLLENKFASVMPKASILLQPIIQNNKTKTAQGQRTHAKTAMQSPNIVAGRNTAGESATSPLLGFSAEASRSKTALLSFLHNILGSQESQDTTSQYDHRPNFDMAKNAPVIRQLPNHLYRGFKTLERKKYMMKQMELTQQLSLNYSLQKQKEEMLNQLPLDGVLNTQAHTSDAENDDDSLENGGASSAEDRDASRPRPIYTPADFRSASTSVVRKRRHYFGQKQAEPREIKPVVQKRTQEQRVSQQTKGRSSMEDLEKQFQQQCDDLLVSISSKMQTLSPMKNDDPVPEAAETLYDSNAISDHIHGGLNLDLEDCVEKDGQTWVRNCPQVTLNNFFHLNSMTLAGDVQGRVVQSPTPDIVNSTNLNQSNKLIKVPLAERIMTPLENGKPANFKLELQPGGKIRGSNVMNELNMLHRQDPISVTDYKALTQPTTQNNSFSMIPTAMAQHNQINNQIPSKKAPNLEKIRNSADSLNTLPLQESFRMQQQIKTPTMTELGDMNQQ